MEDVSLQTERGRDHGVRRMNQLAVSHGPACCVWLSTWLFESSGNTNLSSQQGVSV
jgi:hypothetical protein